MYFWWKIGLVYVGKWVRNKFIRIVMGCGGSVAQNQHLKVVPSQIPPPNSTPNSVETSKPAPPVTASDKTVEKSSSGVQDAGPISKKQAAGRSSGKISAEKDIKSSSVGRKQLGKSSSGVKLTDSAIISGSPNRQKDELRQSSTSKSRKNLKGKQGRDETRSSKGKLTNAEAEAQLRESNTVSVINEQGRNPKSRKEMTHSIKKIKSVKNSKELAELIKIYAL